MSAAWWWPDGAGTGPSARRPLLFVPPAGADQTIAAPLVPHLAGVRLGVLRMPGRGVRRDEPAPGELDALVGDVASSVAGLPGPAPVLVGHSLGALLAFLVARALERQGRPVARLVAVAATAPHAWAEHVASSGGADGEEPGAGEPVPPDEVAVRRRLRRLLADGAVPAEIAAHPELGRESRAALETDVRLSQRAPDPSPVSCPLTVVVARDDALVHPDVARRWAEATTGEVEEVVVAGDHFFYRRRPEVLARLLLGELDALDGAYSRS